MDQRTQFIADFLRDALSLTELCALYGVARKTGYKWIDRYLRLGPAGLEEHSRRPHRAPNQTADEIVAATARENEVRAACVQLHLAGKLARIERPRTDGKKGRATIIYDYADPTLRVGGPSE